MSKKIIRRSKRKTKEKPVQGDFSQSQHVQLNHSTKPQVGNEKGRQMLMEDKKEEGRIAKEREKEIRKYLIHIWNKKKKN